MDEHLIRKLYAAAFCVLLSCVGMTSGLRWLTVVALVLWIAAMTVLGRGPDGSALLNRESGASEETGHL